MTASTKVKTPKQTASPSRYITNVVECKTAFQNIFRIPSHYSEFAAFDVATAVCDKIENGNFMLKLIVLYCNLGDVVFERRTIFGQDSEVLGKVALWT